MDGWDTSSEETSVLVAVFRGSYLASLLSVIHLSSHSRCQMLKYGLVIKLCVCSAPQQVSANSKNNLGSEWSEGVTGVG